MKKEHIVEARNHAYELMLTAQSMMDYAETELDRKIADYLYHAEWSGDACSGTEVKVLYWRELPDPPKEE